MAAIDDLTGKILWLRNSSLGAAGTLSAWADSSSAARSLALVGTGPAIQASQTPNGKKAVAFATATDNGLDLSRTDTTVFTASSTYDVAYQPKFAADSDNGSYWHSAVTSMPQWWKARLVTAAVATGYTVRPVTGTTSGPGTFKFQGSNDDSSWTDLDSQTGLTWTAAQSRTFTFSNSTAYLYYRLYVTAAPDGYLRLGTVSITGAPFVLAGAASRDGELWIVLKGDVAAASNNGGAFQAGSSGSSTHYGFSGLVYDDSGSTARYSYTPTLGIDSWRIYRARVSGTTWTAYIDGNLQATNTSITPSWSDVIRVGESFTGVKWAGKVAEVIAFDRALDSTDATTVSDYLTAELFSSSTVSVAAPVIASVSAMPAPTVSAASVVSVAAPILAAVSALLVPTVVVAPGVSVAAPVLASTSAMPAPTVVSPAAVSVAAPVLALAAGMPAPTVDAVPPAFTVAAPVLSLTAAMPVPTVALESDGVVVPTLTIVSTMLPPAIETDVEVLVTCYDEIVVEDAVYIGLTATPDPDDVAPIMRESYLMPELDDAHQAYQPYVDYPVTREVVGWLHLWIGHQDVTYFRGVPTLLREWYREAPFGDKTCVWEMPQLNAWDKPGEGDLAFLQPDAPVVIGIVDTEGNIRQEWAGFFDSRTKGQGQTARSDFEAKGAFWAALHKIHEPVPYQEPIDIGILIPRMMNAIPGRRWHTIPEHITGLKTRERGARGESVWTVVQRIFAVDGWTSTGRQWTLARVGEDDFAMTLKSPMTHVDATASYGTPLIDVELTIDQSSRVDNAFARGIAENGGGWANVYYPATEIFNGLPYPNADAGDFLNLGATDAGTTSGTGVTDLQEKLRSLGFTRMQPSGTMTAKWVAVVRVAQEALDITVDGSVGPQTWEAVFTTVNEDIDLTPLRLPMAFKPQTWPTLHGANGQILGENPAYDENRIPREVDVDLGPNVGKSRGRRLMKTYLAVHGEPSATGAVELIGCPNEMDRTRLDIGHNLAVPGFDGETPVVQLASKRVQMDGDGDGRQYVATFTVDERARDALTIDQILERDRAALPDPARRPGNPNRLSRSVRDQAFEWDDESPCGVLPKTAVNGSTGLWTRKVTPFSTVGQLSGIDLHSTVPFALGLFASLRLTPNKMRKLMPGGPFASSDPWRPHMDELVEEYGLLACWGSQGNACGYGYGMESDGYSFNGRFREGSTLEYVTETPPYASWLIFARGDAGFVWGEALAARQS